MAVRHGDVHVQVGTGGGAPPRPARGWRPALPGLVVFALTMSFTVALPAPAARADWVRDRLWHLEVLDMPRAWAITRGAGITVAVVDSGVDGSHPDLVGNVAAGANFAGAGDGNTIRSEHGTAMAGLIAAHGNSPVGNGPVGIRPVGIGRDGTEPEGTNLAGTGPADIGPADTGPLHPNEIGTDGMLGIAPEASILPVNHDGSVSAAQAVVWAVDNGADVINCSFGTARGVHDPGIRDAVAYALANDVVVVASAGNSGSSVGFPGGYAGVIGVTGLTRAETLTPASAHGPEVDIAAPAEGLLSTEPGGGYLGISGGTSASAAITSGVVALVRAAYPDLDAANVVNRVISTARNIGAPGRDDEFGYGAVNPVAALTADVPIVLANPLGSLAAAGDDAAMRSPVALQSEVNAETAAGPTTRSDRPTAPFGGDAGAVLLMAMMLAALRILIASAGGRVHLPSYWNRSRARLPDNGQPTPSRLLHHEHEDVDTTQVAAQ